MSEEKKRHISISQIGMVKRCPRQYCYHYIEGRKSPPGIALVAGSSVDEALNLNYSQKIESHEDLNTKIIQEKFSAELDTRIKEVQDESDIAKKDEVKDIVTAGLIPFQEEIASHVQPIDVQTELRVSLDDEYDLLGYVDVMTETHIRDNKTAAKYCQGKYATQLQAYVYMWHKMTGEVKSAALDYLVKTKTPKVVTEEKIGIDPTLFLHEERNAINYIKELHKNPNLAFKNPESFLCSAKWCGFYKECQGVNNENR